MLWGILNVTPDSFSDGGQYFSVDEAVARAEEMVTEGADILDVGGESTRPGAIPVDEAEELRRVLPVIRGLAGKFKVPVSIDTMKPAVARAAIDAGASIINDVGANREENVMWKIAAETGAGYVTMHMKGTPASMQKGPTYLDVVQEVHQFFQERLTRLNASGINPSQVVLDVGIGFGKTVEHNLELLTSLNSFKTFGRPLLLGVSRKSFIINVSGGVEKDRLGGAIACTLNAFRDGVQMFRTHDVAATRQALRMQAALLTDGQ